MRRPERGTKRGGGGGEGGGGNTVQAVRTEAVPRAVHAPLCTSSVSLLSDIVAVVRVSTSTRRNDSPVGCRQRASGVHRVLSSSFTAFFFLLRFVDQSKRTGVNEAFARDETERQKEKNLKTREKKNTSACVCVSRSCPRLSFSLLPRDNFPWKSYLPPPPRIA